MEKKKPEKQTPFKDKEALLRSIFRAAPIGIGLVVNRVITEANERLCSITGYSREELVGSSARMVYPTDEDFEYVGREKNRQIALYGTGTVETRWLTKDGRIIDVLLSSTPLNVKDQSHGVTFTALDITERKRAEEALRSSRELYQNLVDTTLDIIWRCDAEGRITFLNPALEKICGYLPEEVLGRRFQDFKPWEVTERDALRMESPLRGKAIFGHEIVVHSKDGRHINLIINAKPLVDAQGKITGGQGSAYDVTEMRRLQEHVRQSEKLEAIGQLAGGIAHDFNNQLSAILGYAELLRDGLADQPALSRDADNIIKFVSRASELTSQLLAFARKGKFRSVPVDVHGIIEEVMTLLEHSIGKRVTMRRQFCPDTAVIIGDPSQMQNAILNLALNSRDAMPSGGEIVFSTAVVDLDEHFCASRKNEVRPGRYIKIEVTDTGIGMDEEALRRIFEPFYTTKEPGRGTGLGLAAVYGTVKNHEGTIQVYSEPGRGTTFRIFLPLAREDAPRDHGFEPEVVAHGEGRVLLVDDDPAVCDAAKRLIESLGYEVRSFDNGAEAAEYYARAWKDVDLVLLDMIMPGMDGRETFLALYKINPNVKALLASGFSLNGEAQRILDDGVRDFIQKPYRRSELSRKLAAVLLKDPGTGAGTAG